MSERTVAVVREWLKAITDNEYERFFAISSPEIRVYPRAEEPGVKRCYEGWDEMLEYLINWYSGWEEYTFEPKRFIDAWCLGRDERGDDWQAGDDSRPLGRRWHRREGNRQCRRMRLLPGVRGRGGDRGEDPLPPFHPSCACTASAA